MESFEEELIVVTTSRRTTKKIMIVLYIIVAIVVCVIGLSYSIGKDGDELNSDTQSCNDVYADISTYCQYGESTYTNVLYWTVFTYCFKIDSEIVKYLFPAITAIFTLISQVWITIIMVDINKYNCFDIIYQFDKKTLIMMVVNIVLIWLIFCVALISSIIVYRKKND